jgi:hypothetical protein
MMEVLRAAVPPGSIRLGRRCAEVTLGKRPAVRFSDGWDPRLTTLIKAAGTPGRWALLDRAPLKNWSLGKVTLLGDAAHPMFPFFGQGAGRRSRTPPSWPSASPTIRRTRRHPCSATESDPLVAAA